MAMVFNNPIFCDAVVRVQIIHRTEETAPRSPGPEFLVSSGVLAGLSSYFQRAFESWAATNSEGRRVIEIHVYGEKLETLQILLQYMHTKHLPCLDVDCLVDVLELADQYMVVSCVSEVCRQLVEKKYDISTVQKAVRVVEMSKRVAGSLHPATLFAKENALETLLARFGDLEGVWQSEQAKNEFLNLPRDVVVEILKSHRLKVGSENTVFLMVTAWLMRNFDRRSPSDEDYCEATMQIGSLVRFPLLSMNFLTVWAPDCKWVKDFDATWKLWIREALQFKAAGEKGKRASQDVSTNDRFTTRKDLSLKNIATWKIHRDSLQEVLNTRRPLHSPRMFYGGYYWDIEIEKKIISGKPHIGVYLFAYGVEDDTGVFAKGPVQVECSYVLKCLKHRSQGGERVESLQNVKWDLGTGWGWQNFFMEEAAKVLEDGSPYLDLNNSLHFKAVIESIG
ncbi:hypothetical protein BSKO_03950 [Bryopsis sp. KO-2023]|nr:hypothetical protein BSKO_03950 [Bryopsis sp. KO-2023]